MKKYELLTKDSVKIMGNLFEAKEAKKVLVIVHGMCEHMERYSTFASFLCENGITTLVYNIRGHGDNNKDDLGYFADKDGFKLVVSDLKEIILDLKKKYPLDIVLMGHSMGTIVARLLMQEDSALVSKLILTGSPNSNPLAGPGVMISAIIGFFKGKKNHSKLLDDMCFGPFRKSVPNRKTEFDWLSYNEENVRKYNDDPYCGFSFTIKAYNDMLKGNRDMNKLKYFKDVHPVKVFFGYGEEDPCVGGEEGIKTSLTALKEAGFTEIKEVKYAKMRHEILNEDEKVLVYQDLLDFINE